MAPGRGAVFSFERHACSIAALGPMNVNIKISRNSGIVRIAAKSPTKATLVEKQRPEPELEPIQCSEIG